MNVNEKIGDGFLKTIKHSGKKLKMLVTCLSNFDSYVIAKPNVLPASFTSIILEANISGRHKQFS